MNYQTLLRKVRSFGAFIPEKFEDYFDEETETLGEELYRKHPLDISLATGGLYLAMRLPVEERWASLVKEHFTNLKTLRPKDAAEMNNKAFAYDEFGFYRDPAYRSRLKWKTIINPFGIDNRQVLQMYEKAVGKEPKLWEPRYNIAQNLIGIWTWGENPKQDAIDYEKAYGELTKVLEIDANNIHARLRLAKVFGMYVDASSLYEEVLQIDPANKEAMEGLKEFRDYLSACDAESDDTDIFSKN